MQSQCNFWRGWKHTVIRHMEKPVSSRCQEAILDLKSAPSGPENSKVVDWVNRQPGYLYTCMHTSLHFHMETCKRQTQAVCVWMHDSSIFYLLILKLLQVCPSLFQFILLKGGEILNSGFSMLQNCNNLQQLQSLFVCVLTPPKPCVKIKLLESMASYCEVLC